MKKIIYVIVIMLTVYLNVMYKWPAGLKVLAAELVFPVICLGFIICVKRKINAKILLQKDVAEQREELPVQIEVKNSSFFPAVIKVMFTYQYLAEKKVRKSSYTVSVNARKSVKVDVNLLAEYCGKIQFGVPKLKVFDCGGFFALTRKIQEKQSMVIMPKPYPVTLIVSNRTKWFPIDGESYAKDRSGDDSAEIYEVREYRAGDRMQKVHWKLSAKEDDLFIKEFSYPLGAAVVILLEDGNAGAKREAAGTQFIEAVISISMALVEKECAHYVVWKNKNEQNIQRVLIRNEEDFYAFLLDFVEFEKDCLESNMEEYYRYEYKNETYSTILNINTALYMKINKQEPMDMLEHGLETFFETVEIVV